jgi:hypothetical protein
MARSPPSDRSSDAGTERDAEDEWSVPPTLASPGACRIGGALHLWADGEEEHHPDTEAGEPRREDERERELAWIHG